MLTAKNVRIDIARKISQEFLPNEKIVAIAISGSTARGGVDDSSDLEIAIFWKEEPSICERTDPIDNLGGVITRQITPNIEFFYGVDNFNIKELAVDIIHNLTSIYKGLIDGVLANNEIDLKKQALMAITSSLYPLYGEEELKLLKSSVSNYSSSYQKKVLKNTKLPNLAILRLHASRKDFIPFYKHLSNGIISLLSCLCATNRYYFSGDKRVGWLIDELQLKPDQLHEKIEAILRSDYLKAIKDIEILVNDIIKIILENTEINIDDLDNGWKISRRSELSPISLSNLL